MIIMINTTTIIFIIVITTSSSLVHHFSLSSLFSVTVTVFTSSSVYPSLLFILQLYIFLYFAEVS